MVLKNELKLKNLREKADLLLKRGKITRFSRNLAHKYLNNDSPNYARNNYYEFLKKAESSTTKLRIISAQINSKPKKTKMRVDEIEIKEAFGGILKTFKIINSNKVPGFKMGMTNKVRTKLEEEITNNIFKLNWDINISGSTDNFNIHTHPKIVRNSSDLDNAIKDYIMSVSSGINERIHDDFDWKFNYIESICASIAVINKK
jgi:hypothetical protein